METQPYCTKITVPYAWTREHRIYYFLELFFSFLLEEYIWNSQPEIAVARASLYKRPVAVAGRNTGAIDSGITRGEKLS